MRKKTAVLAGLAVGLAMLPTCRFSLAATPTTLPASRPTFTPGWDTVDDRLVFLTTQLASCETSIDAISKRLPNARYAKAIKADQAEGQRKANEQMDRNLGMPTTIRWDQFYGKTAEKFFYHPVDRSTSYHTLTVLGQRNVPATDNKPEAGQGVPLQQRPPQFDYIYRANDERRAMAEADAAKLAGKIDQLTARRRDLEAEQAKLWCQISARAVAYRGLLSTRLYRFDVKAQDASDLSTQRLATFRAAVHFLRVANQLMVNADESNDVSVTSYTQTVKASIGKARAELDAQLVKQPLLALDVTDVETWIGKLTAVARRMDDWSRNVIDSERLAREGDTAGDEQRKRTFRESLQDQLLILAEGVLAGDECVTAMRTEGKLDFDATAPLAAAAEMPTVNVPRPETQKVDGVATVPANQRWMPDGRYSLAYAGASAGIKLIVRVAAGQLTRESQLYPDVGTWEPPKTDVGSGRFGRGDNGLPQIVSVDGSTEEWTSTDGGATVRIRRWGKGMTTSGPPTSTGTGTRLGSGPQANGAEPKIVEMLPANGSKDVDPLLGAITVRFDRAMSGGYSFVRIGGNYPFAEGKLKPRWIDDRTCELPVTLSPGVEFKLGVNAAQFLSFRSSEDVPLRPVVWTFTTWVAAQRRR